MSETKEEKAPLFFRNFRQMRERDEQMARDNPFLAEALEEEKRDGHRLATITRTIALGVVALLLPFLNPHPSVIIYELVLLAFIGMGWLQLRFASVGYSKMELLLINADLILLTLIFTVRNPWSPEQFPNAYVFEFNGFPYFYIILAVATLAYSWRTVWSIGIQVAIFWIIGVSAVAMFGREVPELTTGLQQAWADFPIMAGESDPNDVQWPLRAQEIILFVLVAGILALKGWRSNVLLRKQAEIAAQRANLSRYFPTSMVDTLASSNHDVGAVRNEEIAVLFTDIVGFTQMAEQQNPEEVMDLLRSYHALVEKAIFENNGTLDKYLGDGVMATFGTPIPGESDAKNALNAARQIVDDCEKENRKREAAGEKAFKVSVGVHFGPAILGDIGPERRLEFAVVGDTVNVASRIEATTRELGCDFAVSDELVQRAKLDDDSHGLTLKKGIKLKGRSEPIDIWTNT